jgi:hypothetical protein
MVAEVVLMSTAITWWRQITVGADLCTVAVGGPLPATALGSDPDRAAT